MARFLIDVNLPQLLPVWAGPDFAFVRDIDKRLPDTKIWELAQANNLVIVSKDADFSSSCARFRQRAKGDPLAHRQHARA